LGADFFSGHTIIEKPGKHKITDLQKCEPEVSLKGDLLLCVMANMQDRGILFKKEYIFDSFSNAFTIKLHIEMPGRKLSTIHPFNITFIGILHLSVYTFGGTIILFPRSHAPA